MIKPIESLTLAASAMLQRTQRFASVLFFIGVIAFPITMLGQSPGLARKQFLGVEQGIFNSIKRQPMRRGRVPGITALRMSESIFNKTCVLIAHTDVAGIEALADLPSREVLIARMLGSMMSPVTGLAIALDQVAKKLGGGEETPASEAAAE